MSEAYYTNEFIFRFKKNINFFVLLPSGYSKNKLGIDVSMVYIAHIDDDSMYEILNETVRAAK